MSEKSPEDKYAEFNRQMNAGLELQKQDDEDAERGPIVRQVRAVVTEAYKNHRDENSAYDELRSFQDSFAEHFGRIEAQRYRLYHVIIGSTPSGSADLFDAEGEWSIVSEMRKLAEKYNIPLEEA